MELKNIKSIYVDEAGTTCLKTTNGKDRLYISVAVIVNAEDVAALESKLDDISQRFNHGAALKSATIGNNDKRRIQLLTELKGLPFRYNVLVVDKTKCDKDGGLKFRRTAYKYFAKQLYTSIDKQLSDFSVNLYVDKYGSDEFQNECKAYFDAKCDLFRHAQIIYSDDKSSRLVQLADIVSGTLRQYFYEETSDELRQSVRILLRDGHEAALRQFPFEYRFVKARELEGVGRSDLDSKIARINIDRAIAYINNNEGSNDETERMRVAVLKMLLESHANNTGNIFAAQMQAMLSQLCDRHISKQMMQSKVVGYLRLQGIIIAGDKKGYCLVASERHLRAYLAHDNSVIMPMLAKLNAARNIMIENAGIDPLKRYEDYANLKTLADTFKSLQMQEHDLVIIKGRDESEAA